jgi:hypothetical protein
MLARTLVYLYVLTFVLSYALADPTVPLAVAP